MVNGHRVSNGYYRWDDFFHLNKNKERPEGGRITKYAKTYVKRCNKLGYACDLDKLHDLAEWAFYIDRPSDAVAVYGLLFKNTKDEHKRDTLLHIIRKIATYTLNLYDEYHEPRYLGAFIRSYSFTHDKQGLIETLKIEVRNGYSEDVIKLCKKYHLPKHMIRSIKKEEKEKSRENGPTLTELIKIEIIDGKLEDAIGLCKKYHLSKKGRIIKTLKELSSKKSIKEIPLPKEEPILMVGFSNLESRVTEDRTYMENYAKQHGFDPRERSEHPPLAVYNF